MTEIGETQGMAIRILTEDSQSGFQFFKSLDSERIACVSAEGNSSVLSAMKRISPSELLIVIADGAAFGAFVEKVLQYAMLRCNTLLYFPEAFEWIILKSGVVTERKHFRQMEFPEDYANSEQYMSWEQYFTDLLIQLTKDDPIRQYQKSKLKMFYVQGAVRDQIINTLPEEIKEILR